MEEKVDHSRTLLIPKMISLLLFLIPLSSSRLLDELKSPSFLDEDQAKMRAEMRAEMEVTTEDVQSGCSTIDDQLCKFPFEYDGVTYNTCTSVDNDNRNWCKTANDWGDCMPSCPGETRDPNACYTEDRQLCEFPFEYNGVTYNTCTVVDNYNMNWCQTANDWGICMPSCPGETEDLNACYTEDRQLCGLPFEYNGVNHTTCTCQNELCYEGFCKTESGWGYCNPRMCQTTNSFLNPLGFSGEQP